MTSQLLISPSWSLTSRRLRMGPRADAEFIGGQQRRWFARVCGNDAPYLWWCWGSSLRHVFHLSVGKGVGVRGRPALSRCADRVRRRDDDGVLSPRVCGRSVYGGRPAPGALAAGALRELAARHRSDDGQAHGEWLGGSVDECRSRRVGWGECVVAEFAQDVVGAPAEFARDREAGAVVVDPFCDLEVVGVVG